MPLTPAERRAALKIAEAFAPQVDRWNKVIADLIPNIGIAPIAFPRIEFPRFDFPKFELPRGYLENFDRILQPLLDSLQDWVPANLDGTRFAASDLEQICLVEGISLSGAPRRETVALMLSAPDASARRAILGRRWRSIVSDCETVLASHEDEASKEAVAYVGKIVEAMRGRHFEAAQALTANLLDTILTQHFDGDLTIIKPAHPKRPPRDPARIGEYTVRKYLAVAAVWPAYTHFDRAAGDPVPTTFSRHATAHAVSPDQFTLRNAVQALLLVTGLLVFKDFEATQSGTAS